MSSDPQFLAGKMAAYREICSNSNRRFIAYFEATPDEHVEWKPKADAKSCLDVAAHVAASNELFILALGGNPPATDFPSIFKWIEEKAGTYGTRAEVEAALRSSYQRVLQAFDQADPAMLEHPQFGRVFFVAAVHPWGHAGQVEYVQTCWGDQAFHEFKEA